MVDKDQAIEFHRKHKGMIETRPKFDIRTNEDLALAYTPGVAEACKLIAGDTSEAYEVSSKNNRVAIVTDGTAVLGLGDIGPCAGLPVMDGKAVLFKRFAGIDAVPIILDTKDTEEIISTVKIISKGFAGINLEDISAPRCFEIERRLRDELDIPVFHDDQHGTAIVVLAGLMNALKLTGRRMEEIKVVMNGAGAAGIAIARLLLCDGYDDCRPVKDLIMADSKGLIYEGREGLNDEKKELASVTNRSGMKGSLEEALEGADVFIGVSKGNLLTKDMVGSMNEGPIIFALANPVPEIMPDEAKEAGAAIVATGRSDFPNQVNNALVFPGLFRAALDMRRKIDRDMHRYAARAIAETTKDVGHDNILPSIFDEDLVDNIVQGVREA